MAHTRKLFTRLTVILGILVIAWLSYVEMSSSKLQAWIFPRIAQKMTHEIGDGPSQTTIHSPSGPYDLRLGYESIPRFSGRLKEAGYVITSQARCSKYLREWTKKGVFPIYSEKNRSGMNIVDREGRLMYSAAYPERIFSSFSEIPQVIVNMLLFIENRGLLDPERPFLNPAVDWKRLAKAVMESGLKLIHPEYPAAGGSTLATQLEKFRHSEEGITGSAAEKLRQILSASLRAYSGGPKTASRHQQIIVDYLNSVPLAAFPLYGEIFGLGDGLWVWYGVELHRVIDAFGIEDPKDPALEEERALLLKQVLSLLLAHRKPSYYLGPGRDLLGKRCNAYLRLLAEEGIISTRLKNRAVQITLSQRSDPIPFKRMSLAEHKFADPIRISLLQLLGITRLYDLDRLDLSVKSTLDLPAQRAVTEVLLKLKDPNWVAEKGLNGARLLETGSPEKVTWALTMYEKTPLGNLLRVQTSNSEQMLNINEDTMLDLGSTAKLRTLIHYLEIIASLYDQYKNLDKKALRSHHAGGEDPIRQWAVSYFLSHGQRPLEQMLRASMERPYSANPQEWFYTGGGMHRFENFDHKHDHSVMSIRDGFMNSVNLIFIRLMRDIVRYHIGGRSGSTTGTTVRYDPLRKKEYLSRFADFEGSKFLRKFYLRYRGKSEEEAFALLLQSVRPSTHGLAVLHRFVYPEKDLLHFGDFLKSRLPGLTLGQAAVARLYEKYSPGGLSFNDAGYIAHVHPLELWLVAFLRNHPHAAWDEVLHEGAAVRQDAYSWLYRTSRQHAQVKRIRVIQEIDAFTEIHAAWKRLGYPFDTLVPSYATAIGSSADRPGSLAELMGIILNDGVRMPCRRIQEMHFAAGTPYETHFALGPPAKERVLRTETARMVEESLLDVVRKGTARRLARAEVNGFDAHLGGKTGTGDHRFKTFDASGRLTGSTVMNRTATFAFILGDRFFGDITAYVSGAEASHYNFTSSLPVAVLGLLVPTIGMQPPAPAPADSAN